MSAAFSWFPALAFDLETTHPEPADARVVTATAVEVSRHGIGTVHEWLVDPVIEIPAEATEIHGISTEKARAEGMRSAKAIEEIITVLHATWSRGLPVIAFNANYDMTVLHHEAIRSSIAGFVVGPLIDPFVIDRSLDQRRRGKRTLAVTAAHYGVKQDGAHTSVGDALCAARIAWAMEKRVVGNDRCFKPLRGLTLAQMQDWQRAAYRLRQENYQEYLRRKGDPEIVDTCWPIRSRRDHEEAPDPRGEWDPEGLQQ